MNRLFGKGKPKEPPPNLNDCVANVSFSVCSLPVWYLNVLLFHSGGQQGRVCGQEDCQVGRWVEKIQGDGGSIKVKPDFDFMKHSGPNE